MIICANCNKSVFSLRNGICVECEIGDKDPMLWLVEKIKNNIYSDIQYKNITRDIKSEYESISWSSKTGKISIGNQDKDNVSIATNITYNIDNKTRQPCNMKLYFIQWTNNGLDFYCKDGPYDIDVNNFEQKILSLLTTNLVKLIKFAKSGKSLCTGCVKEFEKSKISGRRFGSLYCSPCWEKYKKQNSRQCRICTSPLWDCCC